MNTKIRFAKIKLDAVIPSKLDEDAGYDIYACFEEDYMLINPHETKIIPTGIASACDNEYCFIVKERGSTGSKGIAIRMGVIDSGYRGEWLVGLTNTTDTPIMIAKDNIKAKDNCLIYPYSKAIAQAILIPVPKTEIEIVSYDFLKSIESKRGAGALGSSNK